MKKIIEISEVNIVPVKPNAGLIGFASFIVNGHFYMGCIGIFTRPDGGIRLVFPRKNGLDCFYPINKQVGDYLNSVIEREFLKIYKNLINNNYGKHGFNS